MSTSEVAVATSLRRKIVAHEIPPGERITETDVARLLGVSRTPARGALRSLEMDGLIEKRQGRGYTVREIDAADRPKAFAVRGVLEGLAARIVAQNGLGARAAHRLERTLDATASIVARGRADDQAIEAFDVANAVFHETIVQECDNDFVTYTLDRLKALPVVNLGAFAFRPEAERDVMVRITVSHSQHLVIHRAIREGDGGRAEAMMREHAHATIDYPDIFAGSTSVAAER